MDYGDFPCQKLCRIKLRQTKGTFQDFAEGMQYILLWFVAIFFSVLFLFNFLPFWFMWYGVSATYKAILLTLCTFSLLKRVFFLLFKGVLGFVGWGRPDTLIWCQMIPESNQQWLVWVGWTTEINRKSPALVAGIRFQFSTEAGWKANRLEKDNSWPHIHQYVKSFLCKICVYNKRAGSNQGVNNTQMWVLCLLSTVGRGEREIKACLSYSGQFHLFP